MEPVLPGATIGVMGGGQLGRMFALAARRMGYRVHVFTSEENSPAGQLSDFVTVAEYDDEKAVRRFARSVHVLTFEFENIPGDTVEWCSHEIEVRPTGAILHTTQNRLREKLFLRENGFPLAAFRAVNSAGELESALEQIGRPAILKTAAWGYDGKGQQAINSRVDIDEIWSARSGDELILEKAIDFDSEISAIVARDPKGKLQTFPIAENVHENHILDVTIVPARVSEALKKAAAELAESVAQKLELVGILAVEMFVEKSGDLIVNELAPRPHNSGHWSIEGCATSQFEQHLRAVCGLPLGSVELLKPCAMSNLLGDVWRFGEPNWLAALAEPNIHLHLYGKSEARPRRKMGHLTAVADSADDAAEQVRRARKSLLPA